MILSLFFPHVLVQVCSSPPEADLAFGLPFPRVLLLHGSHVVLLQHVSLAFLSTTLSEVAARHGFKAAFRLGS